MHSIKWQNTIFVLEHRLQKPRYRQGAESREQATPPSAPVHGGATSRNRSAEFPVARALGNDRSLCLCRIFVLVLFDNHTRITVRLDGDTDESCLLWNVGLEFSLKVSDGNIHIRYCITGDGVDTWISRIMKRWCWLYITGYSDITVWCV